MRAVFLYLLLLAGITTHAQIITTVAGNGTYGYSGNGGPATAAQLGWPFGIVTDNSGNLYIADIDNNVIRKVDNTGIITNFAGTGALGYSGDGGPATAALLYHPNVVALDNAGNMYFADQNGDILRKINTSGIITTISGNLPAGYSGDGGPLILAQFRSISGISFDNAGNMYLADFGNSVIRKVNTAGIITTVAGSGVAGFSGDGGPATAARLDAVYGVVFRSNGDMFIPDARNNRIRVVNSAGIITTYAGTGVIGYSGDGGPAIAASFGWPWLTTVDPAGNIYTADAFNEVVRKIDNAGIVTTYAGNGSSGYSGDGGPATAAQLIDVCGVTSDLSGNIYIVNRTFPNVVRKVTNCLTASISQQPVNVSFCGAGNAIFSVTASNTTGYQWQVNNGFGWVDVVDNAVYSGSATNTLSVTGANMGMDGFQFRCRLSNVCGNIFSTTALLLVTSGATPTINIVQSTSTVCEGAPAVITASITNGGSAPAYQWYKNGLPAGTNSNIYSATLNNGDQVMCIMTSNASCLATPTATSNTITMTVIPNVTVALTITTSVNNICAGTPVTFTSSVTNGGSSPTYTWFKNNVNLFLNSPTYTDNTLNNGDYIMAAVRTSLFCVISPVVPSFPIIMNVTPLSTPAISITASATSICKSTAVSFTAMPVNGGTSPVYAWKKNAMPVGTNSNIYTANNLINGDVINCSIVSNETCLTTSQASSNSISIIVHPDPLVTLDKTPVLCNGATRILDAGSFSSYAWSTGAVSQTITINTTGTYSVTVTDNNGCTGSDATTISTLVPSPAGFLPLDTSVCSYGTITLKAATGFTRYLWNTGAVVPSITTSLPGLYWLEVTNNQGCTNKDTVIVSPKDCMKGFFMPTGFTPNNDGKNDILKPIILGKVKEYQFWIYNRWGQIIFQTTDITKGWNGRLNGLPQDGNIFIWVCHYQFEGEKREDKKGTFVLIR